MATYPAELTRGFKTAFFKARRMGPCVDFLVSDSRPVDLPPERDPYGVRVLD